jgi:hypothetical protein
MTTAEITANVISAAALIVSIGSVVFALLAYRLALRQDSRRNPALTITDITGYVSYEGGRDIAISAVVANQSDSDNAIARVELRVALSRTNADWPVRLPLNPSIECFRTLHANVLTVPTRLQAHDTVSGWLFFHLEERVLGDARVESYIVEITDSHGVVTTFEPILLRDFRAANNV